MTGVFARTVLFYRVLNNCVTFSEHSSLRPITFFVVSLLLSWTQAADKWGRRESPVVRVLDYVSLLELKFTPFPA